MPSAFKEIELKLAFSDESIGEKIVREKYLTDMLVPGTERKMLLETVYYDTPSGVLQRARLSYRIRRQEDEWIATVKADGASSGGLHERSEWSVVVNEPTPDITPFSALPAGERLQVALGEETLIETARTRFVRQSMDLRYQETLIELAVDKGEILAANKSEPIREIELELKEGEVSALLEIAETLRGIYELFPEERSKYHRGLVLAGRIEQLKRGV
ncbi:MAG: CYTH domain-containing protein [Clostridia bacterium]|jgi:inorganic triphosphatase YgiF|nr:CYTH domain-containing protein [Clostridia bacterium]